MGRFDGKFTKCLYFFACLHFLVTCEFASALLCDSTPLFFSLLFFVSILLLLQYSHPSQKGQGLPQAIHAHISAGIEEARKDPESLLIFSGGETRAVGGPQTEAQAYYHVADAMSLWPSEEGSSVRARTTTEEFATDSFENLYVCVKHLRRVS